MMKYNVAVIAGGTIVCPQMRTMRPYSRRTMVLNPVISVWTLISFRARCRRCVAFDQPHEQFFQAIRLIAHRDHVDALHREAAEDFVEALILRRLHFERVIVDEFDLISG